ncbi:MAG TPA: hypothetical protein VLA05_04785 [Coriobacteriia bacterium]|nr:hypothetical protein [Coriobacteriia bacterium]
MCHSARKWLAILVVMTALAGLMACSGEQQDVPTETTQTTTATTAPDTATGTASPPAESSEPQDNDAQSAGLTVGTTAGPYFVSGSPELEDGNLNYSGLEGEPIRIVGHVYGGEGNSKPLAGAKVDMWHADAAGSYHPNSSGDAIDYGANVIALRGFVLTDENGAYAIDTIYPGYYEGRTRHIHVTTTAEDYGSITTQIIVPARSGDGATPENDSIARMLPDENHVTFENQDGVETATFDFHLGGD